MKLSPIIRRNNPSTVVTDTIRRIDYETARDGKLLSTLTSLVNATGLQVAEADLVSVFLRAIPEVGRTSCLHHLPAERSRVSGLQLCYGNNNKRLVQYFNFSQLPGRKK